MAKVKKILSVSKKCIKNPKLVGKGLKYIKNNGVSAFVDKVRYNDVDKFTEKANQGYIAPEDLVSVSSPDARYSEDIKFSIVMPTYNVEIKWLEKAIESVKNQNYTNFELCIAEYFYTY